MPKIDPFKRLIAKNAKSHAIYIRPAASETAIKKLRRAAKSELGEDIPDEYLKLLRLSNGIQIKTLLARRD